MSSKYIKEIRKYAKGGRIELPDRKIKKFSNATAGNYINAIFEIMEDRLRSKKIDTTIDFYKDGIEIIKKISKMYEINKEYVEKRLNSFISLLNATNINTKSKDEEKEEINNAISKLDEDVIKATQEIYETEKEEKEEFALIAEIIENSDNIIRKRERILNVLNERPDLINSKNNNGESVFIYVYKKTLETILNNEEEKYKEYRSILFLIKLQKYINIRKEDKEYISQITDEYKNLICEAKLPEKEKRTRIKKTTSLLKDLLRQNESKIVLNSIAEKHGIKIEFSKDFMKHIKQPYVLKNLDVKNIEEFNISIDSTRTREIDDILYCKKLENNHYELGVSIASVLSYFDFDSEIIQEALERGSSIYLKRSKKDGGGNIVIPLLPEEITDEIISLNEGQERYARTYIFEIDEEGTIVSEKFIRSKVKNSKVLTIEAADKILKKNSNVTELEQTLTCLEEATNLLSKKYKDSEKYSKEKLNQPDPTRLKEDANTKSIAGVILNVVMNLTNSKIAEWFHQNNLPMIYRCKQKEEKVNEEEKLITKELEKKFKNREIEKIRKIAREKENKSFYSIKPGHADKTKKVSTHATSCMRRGADIVVEYILREIYDVVESGREISLEKLNEYKGLLEKICYKLNYQSANIDNFFIEHNNATAKKKKKKEKLKEHRRHKKVYK